MSDENPSINEAADALGRLSERNGISRREVLENIGFNSKGICLNCLHKIEVAIFKGGDYCCDNCRKALGKDIK